MEALVESRPTDVLIIGGGIIGLSAAYELTKRGASVTVIDKGDLGHGCSYGNAGWITPCFAMPLPMPGMLLKAIRWLIDPESPLYIRPAASVSLFRWLLRFLFSMRESQMRRSVAALTELSKYSLEAYAKLDAEFPGAFGFERRGLLMVGQSDEGANSARHEMELVAEHGIPGKYLQPDEIRALEPALTGGLRGGVYFPEEAHCEPLAAIRTLAAAAEARGARLLPRTEAFEFKAGPRAIESVRTTRGWLSARQIVLATGSWSGALARELGLRVPVLGGKGYAVVVKPFEPAPKIPIMCVEKKIAVTPRAGSVRLAGTLELVDLNEKITARRVNAILRGSREFMNVPEHPVVEEIWRGLRPCTPDGVPVIGFSRRYGNLLIATGHQMLGVQSATGTARLAADLLTGAPPAFDPRPFRATRF